MVQTSEGATASTTATDEKKPPCRVCDSFKSYSAAESSKERKAFKQQQQKKKENEGAAPYTPFPCPPDSQKLGRSTWTFLHTMAAYYPEKPTKDEQTTAATFFRTFAQLYPCSYCAQHMREDFKTSPPVVTSNKDMSLWLCNLHNKVNEKLGKPTFDCSKVDTNGASHAGSTLGPLTATVAALSSSSNEIAVHDDPMQVDGLTSAAPAAAAYRPAAASATIATNAPTIAAATTAVTTTTTTSRDVVPADPPASTEQASRKIVKAQQEEMEGLIQFRVVEPDKSNVAMILLTGLKNIYQKQLPNMPKEYIARLVYDRNHSSLAVVRPPLTVVGGITYRAFPARQFAEIVFCAISSTEQVKGYGARLMSHVKDYVSKALGIKHFLTYADNFAIGYFKKQGFTAEITLDKSVWVGYIKDYEGGTLMQCTMVPKVSYLNVIDIIEAQQKAVRDKIRMTAAPLIVQPPLEAFTNGATSVQPEDVPGLVEAGWSAEMQQLATQVQPRPRGPLYTLMKTIVTEMQDNPNAWPFVEPVSGVADYYDIIKEPMDISTLTSCIENDEYRTLDDFVKETNKIFNNCRIYNEEGTSYVKCANKLEKWFKDRLKALRAEMQL